MTSSTSVTVTDPVCGMTIDSTTAVGSSSYMGEAYYFCSRGCETKFDSNPTEYVGTAAAPVQSSCCSTGHSSCC